MRQHVILILLAGIVLNACQSPSSPEFSSSRNHDMDSSIRPNADMEAFISPLRDSVESIMNEVIGESEEAIYPKKPGTPLSNFVADLIREAAIQEIDKTEKAPLPLIAVINIKGLRAPLPEGEIKVEDIYALMPFENQMVILTHSGKQIRELFRHMGESNGDGISGASFSFNGETVSHATINGEPLQKDARYYVATSDYLAEGGDHYNIFAEAEEKYTSPRKIRELIIDHTRKLTKKGQMIDPSKEQRITIN
ncbi:MAG: 5'-nucleotidase C-terminal domain-containing protein [Marinilabiliaceae bacterium]